MNRGHYFFKVPTLGFIGFLPAPGTMGSLCAFAFLYILKAAYSKLAIIHNLILESLVIVVALLFAFYSIHYLLCYNSRYYSAPNNESSDPSEIIIDEVAGCLIALFGLPLDMKILGGAFLLFRFFDITKVLGLSYLEHRFKGAWGILLDDLGAGLYTCLLMHFIVLPYFIKYIK